MALALTGLLSITTACSDDDYTSNLPIYDSGDFESRVAKPAWADGITWYDNADLDNLYNSFKSADLTFKNVGYYEYKEGMNYSTGKEEYYWYYYSASGSSIFLIDGKFYFTNFATKLANLSWSEQIQAAYNAVWSRYLTRSRLTYTFMVPAEGTFGTNGALSIDGENHQMVDLVAEFDNGDGTTTPGYFVMTDTENKWLRYQINGPYTDDESIMKTKVIIVQDVRQQVLDNLDLIEKYFKGNLVYCPDFDKDHDVDINVIREALK